MQKLSIMERISLSKSLGSPIDGVLDKADVFIKRLEPLMKEIADGPREAILLLAMAYVFYSINFSVDPNDDEIIPRAKNFIDEAISVIYLLGEDE